MSKTMTTSFKITATISSLLILITCYMVYLSNDQTRHFESTRVAIFSQQFINVFLVSQGDKHLLIDSGLNSQQADIERFLQHQGVKPEALQAIIVTHGHHDHAGSAAYFQKHYGVKIIAGKGDLAAYKTGKNGKLCPTSIVARARHSLDQAGTFPPFTPDVVVDGTVDLSTLTQLQGKVHSVSAHTPGSLVVVIDQSTFVGDLVRGSIFPKSTAAMHFYQCDIAAVGTAMKHILEDLAPQATTFFPSHLGPTSRQSMMAMLSSLQTHSHTGDK